MPENTSLIWLLKLNITKKLTSCSRCPQTSINNKDHVLDYEITANGWRKTLTTAPCSTAHRSQNTHGTLIVCVQVPGLYIFWHKGSKYCSLVLAVTEEPPPILPSSQYLCWTCSHQCYKYDFVGRVTFLLFENNINVEQRHSCSHYISIYSQSVWAKWLHQCSVAWGQGQRRVWRRIPPKLLEPVCSANRHTPALEDPRPPLCLLFRVSEQ